MNNHEAQLCNITSDKFIVDIVRQGLRINFTPRATRKATFSKYKKDFRIIEITKLLGKRVISECPIEPGDYFSNLFTTPKKDGIFRTILNSTHLNQACGTHHFKNGNRSDKLHM